MKNWIVFLMIVMLLLTGCGGNQSSSATYVEGRWATVTRVADGDTLELDKGEKVRLIGVNTPETVKPNTPVQPYGKEASEFTKKQLEGKKVFVEVDVQPKDQYGRTLAYVYTQMPTSATEVEQYMYNAILVREGYAQLMTIPPNVKYQDLLLKLQRTARQEEKGLWALGIYKDSVKSTNDILLAGKSASSNANAAKAKPSQPASASTSTCNGPVIKGNKSSNGEKVYHVQGGRYYDKTEPEEVFCTEQEAVAAGYRKSKQ